MTVVYLVVFHPLMWNGDNVTPAVIIWKHTDKELKGALKGQAGIDPLKKRPFATIKISICAA